MRTKTGTKAETKTGTKAGTKAESKKNGQKKESTAKKQYLRITDYSQWLLIRLLIIFFLLYIFLIPTVKYLMLVYEGREISYGQAAIFIMQSLTTTGYGELLPFHSLPMTVLSIVLMIVGVILIFIIAGSLMATLIEKNITPRAPLSTALNSHIIITQYNKNIGQTIKYFKKMNIPYIVAAPDQPSAVRLIEQGIKSICADPGTKTGLKALGVDRARLVIAVNDDTTNISIILGINIKSSIPILAVMENETRAELAYAAGAKQVVVVEEKLGQQLIDWICADAIITDFLNLIDVEVSENILEQLKPSIIHVGDYKELRSKTLGDVKLRTETGATVVAVWHPDGTVEKPTADTIIDEATLIVLGPHNNVDRLASFLGGPGPGKKVIIVGAGRVGQEAGKSLNKASIYPTAVDIKERVMNFKGELIVGDGTYYNVLKKAGIKDADTMIVTLHDDNLNIFTTLSAKQLNPDIKVVSRAVSMEAINLLLQAGAEHVLSESIFSFQLLQVALVKMGILPKLSDFLIKEITWEKAGISVRDMALKAGNNIDIICLIKDGQVLKPTGKSMVKKGDRIVILGNLEDINILVNK